MAEGRVRGFSIATKCATVDELIERFRDRVDDQSILVNTIESRDIGTECAFAILLADKKVALAGTCTVMDVFTDANNPFKRPGMRLGIKRLGPASERVFAELLAKRIAPRNLTTAVPVIPIPPMSKPGTLAFPALLPARTATRTRGSAQGMQATQTEPVREPPRRLSTVQIPPRDSQPDLDEPLARVPRATPQTLDDQKPIHTAGQVVEARTPGSSFILPANPLMHLTDASLEGFVECKLGEAIGTPEAFPIGTRDELQTVTPSAPMRAAAAPAVPAYIQPTHSEPLPLPPPPPSTRSTAALPVPYQSTELPKLAVETNDHVANMRVPLVPRRLRNQLLLAILLVPLLGAGSVVAYMQLVATAAVTATPAMPATLALVDDLPVQARVAVEAAPAAPAVPAVPARAQPIHAVLVRSYPIAARVTVEGRYFGTTPTYVKVPANTPVEVKIVRPGFKPMTYPLVSKKRTDRVFVRLQRASKGRR